MAVKLRLRRLGRKKRPFYRIVAADSRAPRDGRFIEEIGEYNPLTNPATVNVQEDRIMYWLGVGATPSKTVKNILSNQGIILKHDLQKKGVPEDKINEELKKWEVLQLEKARRQEARKLADQEKKAKAQEEEAAAEAPTAPAETAEKTETAAATEEKEAAATQPDTPSDAAAEEEKAEASQETPETEETEDSKKPEQVQEAESSEKTEEKSDTAAETSEEEKVSEEEKSEEEDDKKS